MAISPQEQQPNSPQIGLLSPKSSYSPGTTAAPQEKSGHTSRFRWSKKNLEILESIYTHNTDINHVAAEFNLSIDSDVKESTVLRQYHKMVKIWSQKDGTQSQTEQTGVYYTDAKTGKVWLEPENKLGRKNSSLLHNPEEWDEALYEPVSSSFIEPGDSPTSEKESQPPTTTVSEAPADVTVVGITSSHPTSTPRPPLNTQPSESLKQSHSSIIEPDLEKEPQKELQPKMSTPPPPPQDHNLGPVIMMDLDGLDDDEELGSIAEPLKPAFIFSEPIDSPEPEPTPNITSKEDASTEPQVSPPPPIKAPEQLIETLDPIALEDLPSSPPEVVVESSSPLADSAKPYPSLMELSTDPPGYVSPPPPPRPRPKRVRKRTKIIPVAKLLKR